MVLRGGNVSPIGAPAQGGGKLSAERIAQILTSTSDLYHLVSLTDSRLTSKQSEFLTYCPEIKWGGVELQYVSGLASAPAGSHDAGVGVAASTGDVATSIAGVPGTVGEYAPYAAYLTTFGGVAEPNVGNALATRMWSSSGQITQATAPLLWAALDGRPETAKFRSIYKRLPDGTSTDWRLCFHGSGVTFGAPGSYQSADVTDSTGSGYATVEAVIPDSHTWSAYPSPRWEYTAVPLSATVAGEKLLIVSPGWVEMQSGAVLHMHGIGGKSVDGFLDPAVCSPDLFTDYYPLLGKNRLFWLDLGTNNPQSNTRAQHVAKMGELISRIRADDPKTPIMLTTAYATSTSGVDPYWVLAARDLAVSTPGTLLLDTYDAMPDYSTGNALGFYSDTVHYGPLGVRYYSECVGDLTQAAASTSDAPNQFSALHWGYDASRMTESVGVPTAWVHDPAAAFAGDLVAGSGPLTYEPWGYGGQSAIRFAAGRWSSSTAGTHDMSGVDDYSVGIVFRMNTLAVRRLLHDQLATDGTCRAVDIQLNADGSLTLSVKPVTGGVAWSTTTAAGVVKAGVRTVVSIQRIASRVTLWVNGAKIGVGTVTAGAVTAGGRYGLGIGSYTVNGSVTAGDLVVRAAFMWPSAVNGKAIHAWAKKRFGVE